MNRGDWQAVRQQLANLPVIVRQGALRPEFDALDLKARCMTATETEREKLLGQLQKDMSSQSQNSPAIQAAMNSCLNR